MIRLLLVDDQSLICQGLAAVLNQEEDLEVVGSAENGQAAIAQVKALQPDVVLMDIRMPVMTGIEATRLLAEQFPNVKILVLSTFDDDRDIAPELVEAIRLVHRGYCQMAPGLMEKLVTNVSDPDDNIPQTEPEALKQLPPRERDVLRLIGQGCTNREIATQLNLAEGTVKTYVTHILNRLALSNRSQLAIFANSIDLFLNP
jgi:DNA-binding NarL/FixJ family response regulator